MKEQASPLNRDQAEDFIARAQEALRAREAAESVRQQQQGFGSPILSWQDHGYRLIAVGRTILWSKNWIVFTDFLMDYLKRTLGSEWGARGQQQGSSHPIFRWLTKFKDYNDGIKPDGKLKSGPMIGCYACILHLAYSLYLIAHHDQLPKKLLRRLRDVGTFAPAYYETIAGAAFAVAGFEISNAETETTADAAPEYRARSKASGGTYEMEAKRKQEWKASTANVNDAAFQAELKGYIRDQIYKASRKRLSNPIFWLELSIPNLTTEAAWRSIAGQVSVAVKEAESMTIDGKPIAPAYVVVTNHTFLANDDIPGDTAFAVLEPLLIPDYPYGRPMELEEALVAYDKHRDVFKMMEGWRIARSIPVTFDGSPPELLSADGEPQRTIQIGQMLEVLDEGGDTVVVRVEELASMGDTAAVFVHHAESGKRWMVTVPLTPQEVQAAARYTDAVFGKPNASRGLRDDDPFDLYDWLLKTYSMTTAEQLASLFRKEPGLQKYEGLPMKEARIRVAREYTKWMWVRLQANKQKPPDEAL